VRYDPAMNWVLPLPLLLFAGILALVFVPTLARRPVSLPRLALEAFLSALVVVGAVWVLWIAYWLLEQRW
jgi:hypothetical protein